MAELEMRRPEKGNRAAGCSVPSAHCASNRAEDQVALLLLGPRREPTVDELVLQGPPRLPLEAALAYYLVHGPPARARPALGADAAGWASSREERTWASL